MIADKLISKLINKMWYIQTMEYYSVLQRNEILIVHATTWKNLRNIILCERDSQTDTF